jgi:uncharacterized coiled-coil protein SlyX
MRLFGWLRKKPLAVDVTSEELDALGRKLAQTQAALQDVARELRATSQAFSEDMRAGRSSWASVAKRLDELASRTDLGDVHINVAYDAPGMATRIVDGFVTPGSSPDMKDGLTDSIGTIVDLLLDDSQEWSDATQERLVRRVLEKGSDEQIKMFLAKVGSSTLCDDSVTAIHEYCDEDAKARVDIAFHVLLGQIDLDEDQIGRFAQAVKESESVRHIIALIESDRVSLEESTVDELAEVVAEHGTDVDRARFLKTTEYELSEDAQEALTSALADA